MNNAPSLRDLQLWLKWIITDPRGVTEALNNSTSKVEKYESRYTRPTPSYLGFIVNDGARSPERLDVYAEGYFSRILECMAKDFAKTKKAIGEEAFTKLVAEYLKAHPSQFTSIDEVGFRFASFISDFDGIALKEWVSDLAHFEWSWIESFYAEEIPPQSNWQDELAKNPHAQILVHPSVRLVQSLWPIAKLIRDLDSDTAIDSGELDQESRCSIVIYRFNDDVHWEEIDPSIFQILQNLKREASLGSALAQVQDIDPQVVSQNFSHWVERGILCGVLI